jgi:pimeloyl-ACP methyl ester carboxylesterase
VKTGQRLGSARIGRLRAVAAGVALALVVATSGCAQPTPEGFEYLRVTVDGQQTLGISKQDQSPRGVVIYFHGPDADEFAITSDEPHRLMTEALVNAGFAVVSSRASGNAFGNPQSQRNYRELANMAIEHYRVENVFFLAESMGAVAAVNLMVAAAETTRIRGLAAINPAMDLANATASYAPFVAESYADRSTLDSTNPMNLPPNAFAGKRIRLYVSKEDEAVPAGANAFAFQRRFGGEADISVVDCAGRQGDASCLQGDDVLKWFSTLERRVEP